ncbi:phage tail tape measure protein [Thalassobius vesicularis]|uniref:Phage tail tape measure protein n=1 Tax=Thalassobius vesicularis TaxID=1294297 RepID=A0A4S3M4S4_9RHOB|nr:phage tail tape measure C-terminal domain-containing protein [Thalassobius vesicularis]THD71396.1 phage tail tape measure protein [Thalassobius vesicularis]
MSEKTLSVRLSARGGGQVKRELRRVGEAGAQAFERIPREVERANAKLAAFAGKVRLAAIGAATAAAAGAVAATQSAMTRAFEVQRQAQVANADPELFQGWAAGAATVGIEADKLADILKDVNDRVGDFLQTGGGPMKDFFESIAPRVGVTADQFARLSGPEALQLYVSSLERAGVSQQEMTFYLEAMASDATALIPLLRNNGAEMTTLAARAADLGVVMDRRTVAALNRSRLALAAVGQVMTGIGNRVGAVLAPVLERLAGILVNLAGATGPVGRVLSALSDQIGRLAAWTGTFVALIGARWVAGLAAAAVTTLRLAGALSVLKGALIRTGIGALIVGSGELVYWFTRLAEGAGGFGEAMRLLKDVAVEVWDRIQLGAAAAGARAAAMFYDLKSDAASAMASAIESVVAFGNAAANTFEGALLAVRAIWSRLPEVIGDLAFVAANRMLDGVEAMLNGAIRRIDAFTGRIREALAAVGIETTFGAIGEIDLGDIANPFAGASAEAGTAAAEAFRRAFEDTPLTVPDLGLEGTAAEALATAGRFRQAAEDLIAAGRLPLEAWQALREAVAGAGGAGTVALDAAAASADKVTGALGRAGGAAKGAKAELTGFAAVQKSLSEYARDAMNWGKGLGETLVSAFQGAETALRGFVEGGKLDFRSLIRSMIADLAMLAIRRNVLGPLATALVGVFGGGGSGLVTAAVSHTGGMAGMSGVTRSVPAAVFDGAPRLHGGGWAGLRPDEVPTILQRGERVLSRREVAQGATAPAGAVDVRIWVDQGGNWQAAVERISGTVAAGVMQAGLRQYDREVLPARVGAISADPRRVG